MIVLSDVYGSEADLNNDFLNNFPAGTTAAKRRESNQNQTMTDPMLQFFSYDHLPAHLQVVSAPFGLLAQDIIDKLPRNPERTVALRKLLESKDCAVRALLFKEPHSGTVIGEAKPRGI